MLKEPALNGDLSAAEDVNRRIATTLGGDFNATDATIMTSFQDIGARGSASLAVVAPGISEALVATAAGLAVAIPAVVFFNYFSNQLAELEGNMQNFSDDLLNLVERDFLGKMREKA